MSDFAVLTHRVVIEPHPDADRLECARVGDFYTIVGKGQFKTGDVVAYIPESAILPDSLIEEMGLSGKLAGSEKNRVKAVKLRGVVSQGLTYRVPSVDVEGVDVTEMLGITKYEPPIPANMAGEVWNATGKTLKYDIENIKMYPDEFEDGEDVVFTEKLHGTWCCLGMHKGEPVISSKGLSQKGLAFKVDGDANKNNLYVRQYEASREALRKIRERIGLDTFYVLGEIFGKGVQDLDYGVSKPSFRVFDIWLGEPSNGYFLSHFEVMSLVENVFDVVPLVYSGAYSKAKLEEFTNGQSSLAEHLREGVVVKPSIDDKPRSVNLSRRILKSVSTDYSLRKGNVTEYQ